ncbi:NCS2 family permease [Clostridium sp. CX1]|uniref:NCS2 family permease n=1 Tax=Clostridium tanneri TaxID=3037988 RepID=A0ABU4JQB4_9CLOT|nr:MULTISPECIES: NCS2 family permease [unclassified Clostridium]MCT8977725.1 NCS2 family permease [Clostridium sp. CX1]MDW8800310.1 NCS2 family permease [Clostridium sp. A1-XYC3]
MLHEMIKRRLHLYDCNLDIKKELVAGVISFFTVVYIIAVNSSILSETGIPIEAGMVATIAASFFACMVIGFWANVPIVIVPGMGINALFSYTVVKSIGLSWQEALAVVFVSGILFTVIASTSLAEIISDSIPHSLKEAITVGLGLFLTLIGLEKGGMVIRGTNSILALGHLNNSYVLATVITLVITIVLFIRNVPANFLLSILLGTVVAIMFGVVNMQELNGASFDLSNYGKVLGAMSFSKILSYKFWMAVFSLTMVMVFESIGLIHGQLSLLKQPEKYKASIQAVAVSTIASGVFGTSPTVPAVESAAGIAAGGKTGITAITAGGLFLASLFFLPVIKIIPGSAIAPVLVIIGALMVQNVKNIDFGDLSEGIPAFLIIVMIPFTYSISDGIAFGFIAYPILKVALGKAKKVSMPLYIISCLFLISFIFR